MRRIQRPLHRISSSISKSITAVVAGILEGQGIIDPHAPLVRYVPEVEGGAFGDCTMRHLLDMRVSLSFDESCLDVPGDYASYRRATLWNPAEAGMPVEELMQFLAGMRKGDGPHGGPFRHASPNSDMLGMVVERAAGQHYCQVGSDVLWQPLGAGSDAFVTVDAVGTARAAGGLCVSARDLARLGELIRQEGCLGGRQIVPSAWIADMRGNGDREAWKAGDFADSMPNGRYRGKWYVPGDPHGSFCGIGIHGQWIWVDPEAGTVMVLLSSQPEPQDEALSRARGAFFVSLNRHALVRGR